MRRLEGYQKHLRTEMTKPEQTLWSKLRSKQVQGLKFRQQVPIGPYIVDFLCVERKLIIEIDGDTHAQRYDYDQERTAYLEKNGYFVCRYTNRDVMINIDGVICDITSTI